MALSSLFERNSVEGIGGGGAIYLSGSASLRMEGCLAVKNKAREGGAVWLVGQSSASIANGSQVSHNAASDVAGAIAATQDSSLGIMDSTLLENSAKSRGSAILAFNDNSVATYSMSNCTVVMAGPENGAIMIGKTTISNSSNEWKCGWPGPFFLERNALKSKLPLSQALFFKSIRVTVSSQ